jgi:tetratricopeptide (TPR) repeat protein
MRGRLHIRTSEFVEAKDSFAQAKAAFTALNDEAGILSAVLGTADSVWRMGDWATARRLYERGLSLAARLGDGGQMSVALIGLGDVHTTEGRPEEAREALDTALRYAEENGLRARVANIHNNIGELEKDRNNFEAAEAAYRRASAMYTALHSPDLWIAQINLALVFLRRRDFAAARDLVERVEPTVAPDLVRMTSAIHSSLAACAAARGDLASYDRRMKAAIQALEEHGGAHLDDAWPIAMAGELVAEWDPERATIALEYACGLWQRLGRSQEVAKLQRVIDALADE